MQETTAAATVTATEPANGNPAPVAAPPSALATRSEQRPARVVVESKVLALDTAKFEQIQRVALAMASASILPDHLVAGPWFDPKKQMAPGQLKQMRQELGPEEFGKALEQARQRTAANCFLVAEQAFRWGMSPFAVAPETYVVGGKLAFQGKLVLAVVNELAGLEGRIRFLWDGAGEDRSITIRGRFRGEAEDSVDTIVLKNVKTDNKMWRQDPDQKLIYTGILHWARRYCPEVVLGVKTVEDLEKEEFERVAAPSPLQGSALDAFAAGGSPPSSPSVGSVLDERTLDAPAVVAEAAEQAPAGEDEAAEPGADEDEPLPEPQAGKGQLFPATGQRGTRR